MFSNVKRVKTLLRGCVHVSMQLYACVLDPPLFCLTRIQGQPRCSRGISQMLSGFVNTSGYKINLFIHGNPAVEINVICSWRHLSYLAMGHTHRVKLQHSPYRSTG